MQSVQRSLPLFHPPLHLLERHLGLPPPARGAASVGDCVVEGLERFEDRDDVRPQRGVEGDGGRQEADDDG